MDFEAITAALTASDSIALTDALAGLDPADPASLAGLHQAVEHAFARLAPVDYPSTTTVNEVVFDLAQRARLGVGREELDRRFADGPSRRDRVDHAEAEALRRALRAAYAERDALRDERQALEDKVAELAGARVLADTLAAELERDEWIRARLRKLKATLPVRAAIKLRKRLRPSPRAAST